MVVNTIPINMAPFTFLTSNTDVMANPARANGLYPKKGCIRPGSDADILFLDEEFLVDTVFARGRKMVEHGKALVKGPFETNYDF